MPVAIRRLGQVKFGLEKRFFRLTPTQIRSQMQHGQLTKMFFVGMICSVAGAIGMGVCGYFVVMATLIIAALSMLLSAWLKLSGKISEETAGIIPMAILCFVYTPAAWFTFNGLMGGAPYQAILLITMILLSYYGKPQRLLLLLYMSLLAILLIVWFASFGGNPPYRFIWGTLVTFLLAIVLTIVFLQKSKQHHLQINENLLDQSNRDAVTQLFNRRAIDGILEREEARFQTGGEDYIVIMLDVDEFKRINDSFGHTIGDSVLRSVAERLSGAIREQDFAARYGGDEFLIVLSVNGKENANSIYERITANVCRISGYAFEVLVSAGGARRRECESLAALIALADQRMYDMKRTRAGAAKRSDQVPMADLPHEGEPARTDKPRDE